MYVVPVDTCYVHFAQTSHMYLLHLHTRTKYNVNIKMDYIIYVTVNIYSTVCTNFKMDNPILNKFLFE